MRYDDGLLLVMRRSSLSRESYPHSALTGQVIGCAMTVHSVLGPGFQEVVYQRALGREMEDVGVSYGREVEMPVFYKQQLVGNRRVDFLVGNAVAVEIKAVHALNDIHLAQAINYLEAFNIEIGLLINFGAKRLEFRRVMNNRYDPSKGV